MPYPVDDIVMHPIAYLRTSSRYRYEAPRQASFSDTPAVIEFVPGHHYDVAAEDLTGFDRIWIVFYFHLNENWNPKVSPPLTPDGAKYGVFATRSPHRPNRVGLSCVELVSVEKDRLLIRNSDLLDATPILDIKPYIPEVDSFPNSAAGWRDRLAETAWSITSADPVKCKSEWIFSRMNLDLMNFAKVQLTYNPLDFKKKRLAVVDSEKALYTISCRTWKLLFQADESARLISILDIFSNYQPSELEIGAKDIYSDKEVHREFLRMFHAGQTR